VSIAAIFADGVAAVNKTADRETAERIIQSAIKSYDDNRKELMKFSTKKQ